MTGMTEFSNQLDMRMRRANGQFLRFVVFVLGLSILGSNAYAQRAVAGDYDRDGKSDIVLTRNEGGFKFWFARFSNGTFNTPFLFGLADDGEVAADFYGDGRFLPAVTRPDSNGFVTWYMLAPTAEIVERQFGLQGDILLANHMDLDDIADLVAVRKLLGGLTWFTELSSTRLVQSFQWGLETDLPFLAFLDGNTIADAVVVRKEAGFTHWFVRTDTGTGRAPALFGLATDIAVQPVDMDGDGIADFIVRRNEGGFASFYVRFNNADGSEKGITSFQIGLEKDDIVFGNYFDQDVANAKAFRRGAAGAEATSFVRLPGTSAQSYVEVAFGLSGDTLISPQGLPVKAQEVKTSNPVAGTWQITKEDTSSLWVFSENGTFVKKRAGQPVDGRDHFSGAYSVSGNEIRGSFVNPGVGNGEIRGRIASDGTLLMDFIEYWHSPAKVVPCVGVKIDGPPAASTPSPGGGSIGSVCTTTRSPFSGFLWKPASTHSGGTREGRPMIAWKSGPPNTKSCLRVYAENGQEISRAGLFEANGKYGARWYTGWGCGDQKSANEIASAAYAAAGSTNVYLEGNGGSCIGPINPNARNGNL
ncbi:MAG: VCBS repeat-containing protein [Bdellovibrionales bacterium]|nr:VCBS repeat-containing protein [Bdellovibrionales bacterium]